MRSTSTDEASRRDSESRMITSSSALAMMDRLSNFHASDLNGFPAPLR
jgi:hypothetical protein